MRILHFGAKTYPPKHGGVERVVYDLHRDPAVQSYILANSVDQETDRISIKPNGFRRTITHIVKLCQEHQIDILHFHKETSIPYAVIFALRGKKCILTIHGFGWRIKRWTALQRMALWALDLVAYFSLKHVVFCGKHDYNSVRAFLPKKNLCCIENGIEFIQLSNISHDKGTIVYIGRISPEKNIIQLALKAKESGIEIDFYGPIDQKDSFFIGELEQLIRDKVINWLGVVDYNNVQQVISNYIALINVSFAEGMPLSVIEGAAQGLHLILSDIPAHRNLEFPDVQYINPHDINLNSIDIVGMVRSKNNAKHASEYYSVKKMRERYYDLYCETKNEQ